MAIDAKDQSTVDCFDWVLDGRAKNGGSREGAGRKKKAFSTIPARIDERVLPLIRVLEKALVDETIDITFLDSLADSIESQNGHALVEMNQKLTQMQEKLEFMRQDNKELRKLWQEAKAMAKSD